MIDLEKFNIKIDKRILSQILFYSAIVISLTGFMMFMNGFNRFSISGIRKDSGRVEFEFYDNYLYMFSHNTESYAPVTDIKYYKSDSKKEPDNPLIVFFTTTNEYKFYAKVKGIDEDDLKELYKELSVFMDDESIKEFGDSFFFLRFYGFFGLIIAGLIGYYIIPLYKQIPAALPKPKKEPKAKGKEKAVKKDIKVKKIKKVVTAEMLLKIILPVFDHDFIFKPEIYDTPYTHGVALACTPLQKTELLEKYGDDYEYIICEKNTSTAEMTIKAETWVKELTGYLIVQTANIPDLTSSMLVEFYKAHKNVQNECTILATESFEPEIPYGKIMRNMANRIVTISETNESNDTTIQAGQVSLGLFCFNTKKVFETLKSLDHGDALAGVSLIKIVDRYQKNRSKMNTFVVKTSAKHSIRSNIAATETTVIPSKNTKAIILSTNLYDADRLKNIYETLKAAISDVIVIVSAEHRSDTIEILGDTVKIVISEGKLGDADDILRTNDHLRDFHGLVLVVTEDNDSISKDMISKLISEHTNQNNICSYVKNGDNNSLYCADAFQFLYAVKKIGRNMDDKKYHLSDLTEILLEANKRVQEVIL
ncbi:MAG: hypothetical protein JXR69_00300 [Candidatus Delongbacteria bacterium]|nr:hypothetical protein [Candidatus Delongbacteria bacterium]